MKFNDPNGPWCSALHQAQGRPYVGYTIAKYGMTLCALGFAAEFADDGIASNALWPRTPIATAAVTAAGVTDFDQYAYYPGTEPAVDLFVDHA